MNGQCPSTETDGRPLLGILSYRAYTLQSKKNPRGGGFFLTHKSLNIVLRLQTNYRFLDSRSFRLS